VAYLDLAGYKAIAALPPEDVDLVEGAIPGSGYVSNRLAVRSARIDSQLRKRYAVPFEAPVPDVVKGWLAALVDVDVFNRRGRNPQDQTIDQLVAERDTALAEIKEAADAVGDAGGTLGVRGMFDLPLRQDTTETGISRGGPLGYSEPSPYEWIDAQVEYVRGKW
jgi:hypothetical protein